MEPNEILRPTETETVNALLVEVGRARLRGGSLSRPSCRAGAGAAMSSQTLCPVTNR